MLKPAFSLLFSALVCLLLMSPHHALQARTTLGTTEANQQDWSVINASTQAMPNAMPVGPGALSTDDEKKIRTVVQGQLDALAKDDAVKAFSFAAPNVREAFITAPRFLDMVQRGYPVVYRPASVAFLKAEGKSNLAFQRVQMTDQAGELWLVTYSLGRQKSGLWRITGCSVVENRSRMI